MPEIVIGFILILPSKGQIAPIETKGCPDFIYYSAFRCKQQEDYHSVLINFMVPLLNQSLGSFSC